MWFLIHSFSYWSQLQFTSLPPFPLFSSFFFLLLFLLLLPHLSSPFHPFRTQYHHFSLLTSVTHSHPFQLFLSFHFFFFSHCLFSSQFFYCLFLSLPPFSISDPPSGYNLIIINIIVKRESESSFSSSIFSFIHSLTLLNKKERKIRRGNRE